MLENSIHLAPDLVTVIQGIRRSGKSTLLVQLMTSMHLAPEHCFFINFEDPRLSNDLNSTLLDDLRTFADQRVGNNVRRYFFLDEIQNVKNWERWLRVRLEQASLDVFIITGSNASLLSGELATTLTGRHITIEVFPFSYAEFLRTRPKASFEDYLQLGGFPRTLTYQQPEQLLREYFTDIVERDVKRQVNVRSLQTLSQLVKIVFESAGSETSLRKLATVLDIAPDTVGSYLSACEAAYIILQCPYFSFSEKKRISRNRKYYAIDLGLRRSVVSKTGLDLGKSLGAVVFHTLRKRYKNVYYWREKGEVDFVVYNEGLITPYQVSWNKPEARHVSAANEFKKAFPQAEEARYISRENVEEFLLENQASLRARI
ncbi:ATP-binding protein [bacterium]|nr:ATP-binding protein [bacterium]